MRFQDVLGYQVLGYGPEDREILPVRVSGAGYVVDEGIKPDIGDIIVVEGKGDAQSSLDFGREMQRSSKGSRRKARASFL